MTSTATMATASTTAGPTFKTIATPTASELLFADDTSSKRLYWDRSFYDSIETQKRVLAESATLYVGNLAFSTRTAQIRSHFAMVGKIKQIHIGLDRHKKTPCGFCFVEYYDRASALSAVANLSGSKLDGRIIRVELDAGFHPGRQYGRGRSGGQVRDDKRATGRRGSQSSLGSNNNSSDHYGPGMKRERENPAVEGEQTQGSSAPDESMEQSAKRQKME
ncbi:cap-binding protein subunit 2 [Seminavis robusta]|uniref:Nuclear cap-binding protein subunit 2 n=1 Tax=Seminavis robusta TaxID=568900 RepID=A0A9N8ELU3_9STRA|nr:cap-binding protein subunit 2 [Seminavis robusta]CAB9521641.1 cap-binding protein subunit 2 [Seminavis robusta]|eukprot:Sro1218_g253290.1 cap-binding protein subunit 2 (220) ;mRNA; r:9963-10622